jgi:hypothetical protein
LRRNTSRADQVLAALYNAANGTTESVAYEEIVLSAWRLFPEAFSLRNHPEYPDASDVHKPLYSTLRANGLVEPVGDKRFRLTNEGRRRSVLIRNRGE